MKRIIIYAVCVLILGLMNSCKDDDFTNPKDDDFTNPNNLKGTVWKTATETSGAYWELTFPGNTSYKIRRYYGPQEGWALYDEGSFTIDENILKLDSDDGYTDRATIEGNKITYSDCGVFIKQ